MRVCVEKEREVPAGSVEKAQCLAGVRSHVLALSQSWPPECCF